LRSGTLKAEPSEQLRLLDLQTIDSRLELLTHKKATLPELAELSKLAARRTSLADDVVLARTDVEDLTREQRKADSDVEQVKARLARDQRRLDGGLVGSPKELESLQHEIISLDRRIAELEDSELEVMEQLEVAQTKLDELQASIVATEVDWATTLAARDKALAEIDEQSTRASADRDLTARDLPAALLGAYDKLRAKLGGVGAAALMQKRCGGCRLEVNAAELARIVAADPDEVLRCEECGRILVRTEESGI
jgi:predicted  nucleic acid-binding Zn-ribbon protein